MLAVNTSGQVFHAVKWETGAWTPFSDVEAQVGDLGHATYVSVTSTDLDVQIAVATSSGDLYHAIRYAPTVPAPPSAT